MLPKIARILLGVVLAVATVTGVCLLGVATTMGASYANPAYAVPDGGWPEPARVPSGRVVVAVVAGASGSVVTDVLAPYEVFARSGRFFVYTVSARREPVVLSGGLRMLPDHGLADAPPPDVVVVPAVVDPVGEREAGLRAWIGTQARRGARVLGVCVGSELAAASGVLDGRRATSHWAVLGSLRSGYPGTRWVEGERYVEDGPVITTAGVTSGVAGALRMVELLAGGAEAERVGREVGYPGWRLGGPTAIPKQSLGLADLPYALNAAFPWFSPAIGIGLTPGVGEIDAATAFEVYAGSSFAARTVAFGMKPVVTTRHGVTLLTEPVAPVSRLIVPGVRHADLDSGFAAAETPQDTGKREFGADPLLRDLARNADQATARATAKFAEYPAGHLTLTGPAWPWRPTGLLALTLVLATAVAFVPLIITRAWRSRLRTPAG
ncbi:hypothetical protein Aple_038470 [Acrocarpospora pleiomorpha]|uniref:DJ-1/PfpI domain-containing protein n=1 Tax=Acrocarpospora pleiomorpha TaxID=90975 RepID=A0A5M3XMT0_9ACTN|nr:DJ-1/PfpI family protein [Acrocarpospora pleiomorpha]GES20951.1 hypothetical protein Aple_038470 [Acrocarpospora pleiomorpha]